MQSNKTMLATLELERRQLAAGIRKFAAKAQPSPTSVVVMVGEKKLSFTFKDDHCVATPPNFSWALRWSLSELRSYFEAKRMPISQEAVLASPTALG